MPTGEAEGCWSSSRSVKFGRYNRPFTLLSLGLRDHVQSILNSVLQLCNSVKNNEAFKPITQRPPLDTTL